MKAKLKAKQAELLRGLRNREGIEIQQAAESLDQIQFAGERDVTIAKLNIDSGILRYVRAALGRISEGRYGTYVHCDEAIGTKRLAAVPWTAYCLECQAAADRGEFEELERATKGEA